MNARVPARAAPARFDLLKAESFVRGESMLAVLIDEPVDAVCQRLEDLIVAAGYVLVARHDLAERMGAAVRQTAPGPAWLVYDIETPGMLAQVLAADPAMAHALPCRVVVQNAHGPTTVTTPRPAVIWPELSHAPQIAHLARNLERSLQRLLRGLQ